MKGVKKISSFLVVLLIFNLIFSSANINYAKAAQAGTYMDINYPDASGVTTEDGFHITGWAVSQQSIDKINVYVDGNYDGSAYYGAPTGGLVSYYPTYPNSDKAGYDYYIEPLKYSVGDHIVRVEAIGKDGSKVFQDRKVVIQRSRPAMDINWPNDGYKVTGDGVHITGWAVNKVGVKEINVYSNGNFAGKAYYGAPTGGLTGIYGTYANSANAGYDYFVYANNYPEGKNKFTLEAIGNDNKVVRRDFTLEIVKENPAMDINYPNIDENIKDDFRITGWAVNKSGVKQINVYDNGKYVGQANYGAPTGGLLSTFPSYPNAKNAGYEYYVDLSKYSSGEHVFLVEAIGSNGTKSSQTRRVVINKPVPAMDINSPSNGNTLTDGIYVRGWSVAKEGIRDVKVYLNNAYLGQANYGEPTPSLSNYYSGYKNVTNGGYSYFIETKEHSNGSYVLRVDATTNSGEVISQSRNVVFNNIPKLDINSISNWGEVKGSTYIGGWALSGVGIKNINVSVDNTMVGQAIFGYPTPGLLTRIDYPQRMNAGYGYWLDTANYSNGYHTVTVTSIGNDNSKNFLTYTVKFNNTSKLIVIDPGHNNGGDDGAYSKIDGITYSERELNMQVAVKLKSNLEKFGYNVMLTRQPWDISYQPSDVSLKNRADFANNLNANLFISIHHDTSSDGSTSGISTHYSTYRPNIDNDGIVSGIDPGGWSYDNLQIDSTPGYVASKSRELANKLVNNVASSMGSANLKAHDHGLYVTRYTNMPSTLIECGFISNKNDALNAANADHQERLAQSIAYTINLIQFN